MDKKDIQKKMLEVWNHHAPEQPDADKQAAWNNFAAEAFPRKKRYKKWLYPAVAAVLLLSLGIGTFINRNTNPAENSLAYTIIENPSVEIKVVNLPDGSVVALEPDAEIRYAEYFTKHRQVTLTGRASFKVHKDKAHPFTVTCQETTTTVLGTVFTINSTVNNTVQVNLYEGRVQMNVKGKNSNWVLAPGEQFTYRNKSVSVEAFNRFRDFNDTEVRTVLNYIETTYGYRTEMPVDYLSKKITLRLNKKESLENVVGILAQMYNLKPVIDEKQKKIIFR
jgi:transmembrane sensor